MKQVQINRGYDTKKPPTNASFSFTTQNKIHTWLDLSKIYLFRLKSLLKNEKLALKKRKSRNTRLKSYLSENLLLVKLSFLLNSLRQNQAGLPSGRLPMW